MPVLSERVIRSFDQVLDGGIDPAQPVVTLFSGGLDSTYLLLRLQQAGFRDVLALSIDLGDDETHEHKRSIARALGIELRVVDGREQFANEYVRAAIMAHAVYLGIHPVSSTLSRPLIARIAVDVAREVGASAVLHTANRSQNSLRRLNGALELLGFAGAFGSPYDLEPVDREQKNLELKAAGLEQLAERVVSGDSNLWCREFESGILDDPEAHAAPEDFYTWSRRVHDVAEAEIEVSFSGGVPTSVDGRGMPLVDLIAELNHRVGAFGIGRYSGLEHLDHGEKVLEIREMPAAWLLLRSYRHLESATLDAETIREKMHLEQTWMRESLEGRWYGELHAAVQSFVESCAERVTGTVRWLLRPGCAETRSISAPSPRYIRDREAWEKASIAREARPHARRHVGSAPHGPTTLERREPVLAQNAAR